MGTRDQTTRTTTLSKKITMEAHCSLDGHVVIFENPTLFYIHAIQSLELKYRHWPEKPRDLIKSICFLMFDKSGPFHFHSLMAIDNGCSISLREITHRQTSS